MSIRFQTPTMEGRKPRTIKFLDGGLGTTLETIHGVKFSESTPLWSSHLLLTDLQTLADCQMSFAKAGADVITTATYQVSIEGFKNTKTENWPNGVPLPNIGHFLKDAVSIARRAAGKVGGRVALSLGPYGATMIPSTEYTGHYDIEPSQDIVDKLFHWHSERYNLYVQVPKLLFDVSYIAFETIPRLDEILAIRRFLNADISGGVKLGPREFYHDIPVWISVLFPGDDDKMPDGTSVEDAVAAMMSKEFGSKTPQFVGINCTQVSKLDGLVRQFTKAVEKLVATRAVEKWPGLVLYPDGTKEGERYNTATKEWEISGEGFKKTAEDVSWERQLAMVVKEAYDTGGWSSFLIGGCCRTTPENIQRLTWAIRE
ncbi:AdoMet-homocysteine methyltransferase [Podospora bellae-mahoneyi]|uniref:AdoMet-homocysteine methyltransferase n=1 Tax=Podospora bellae-mahoneyi TaxID=2093777 RepID=A0ABR0FW42_9PEZI|nr:AdoMet-homocysteine methyltransferase [Podospora bellae-mahoneyi]